MRMFFYVFFANFVARNEIYLQIKQKLSDL